MIVWEMSKYVLNLLNTEMVQKIMQTHKWQQDPEKWDEMVKMMTAGNFHLK